MKYKKLYVLLALATFLTIVALSYPKLSSSLSNMLKARQLNFTERWTGNVGLLDKETIISIPSGANDTTVTYSYNTNNYSPLTSAHTGVCQRQFQIKHLMTVKDSRGRLGNNLFQLLTLLGAAREHCYTPVITEQFAILLNQVFNLSFINTISKIPESWDLFNEGSSGTVYAPKIEKLRHDKNWTLDGYFQSWRYFDKHEDYIKSRLRFRNEINEAVLKYLASTSHFWNKTKICVHQRRGDFIDKKHSEDGFSSPGLDFLNRAMHYFLKKLSNQQVAFIYLSDDIEWCKKNVKGASIYFSPFSSSRSSLSPGKDLALMSLCDHNVVSSGSFGWLGAWLGQGRVVYFNGFPVPGSRKDKRMNRYDYYPPKWIGMP